MEISIRFLDVAAIAIYLIAMIAVGYYCARKRTATTEAYFLGNRSFGGWSIGMSMLGTNASSATFLALPAAAYILDWRQLSVNLLLPFVAIIAIIFFIPFFRRAQIISAFEYLGKRFGEIPRLYGTLSFVILQVIRMAQVLFLVALPIQFLTGLPMEWVIIGTGLFIGCYTVAGGITAVIWSDVIQTIILLVGGAGCALLIIVDLPGGIGQVIEVGREYDKFSLGSFDWDLAERTFWTVAILGVINWLQIYSSSQPIVQRYVAAKSMYEARKGTLIFSILALPLWTLFFFVGTAVFVFYTKSPDPLVAGFEADQVLPYFILTHVPAGVAGIIVAAIIAAAMSTIDSGINSISTVATVDVVKPYLAKNRTDLFYLRGARSISAAVTLVVIVGAFSFSRMEKESMNDISLIVTSVFGGCLMALFMMGFFTRRVDGVSATIAIFLAMVFNVYLGFGLLGWLPEAVTINVHSYWVGALVNGAFIVLAYAISLFRRMPPGELTGLTVWTMRRRDKCNGASSIERYQEAEGRRQ